MKLIFSLLLSYNISKEKRQGVKVMLEKRNPKVVHVDYEEKMSLDEAATFLQSIATKLKEEKTFTLTHGEKSFDVTPSDRVELEVKFEERNGKYKLELELEWTEGEESSGLKIE